MFFCKLRIKRKLRGCNAFFLSTKTSFFRSSLLTAFPQFKRWFKDELVWKSRRIILKTIELNETLCTLKLFHLTTKLTWEKLIVKAFIVRSTTFNPQITVFPLNNNFPKSHLKLNGRQIFVSAKAIRGRVFLLSDFYSFYHRLGSSEWSLAIGTESRRKIVWNITEFAGSLMRSVALKFIWNFHVLFGWSVQGRWAWKQHALTEKVEITPWSVGG